MYFIQVSEHKIYLLYWWTIVPVTLELCKTSASKYSCSQTFCVVEIEKLHERLKRSRPFYILYSLNAYIPATQTKYGILQYTAYSVRATRAFHLTNLTIWSFYSKLMEHEQAREI